MTTERKANVAAFVVGGVLSCIILAIFSTPLPLIGGFALASAILTLSFASENPASTFLVVVGLAIFTAIVGFFRAVFAGPEIPHYEMFFFGFGAIIGSIFSLMLDHVRNSVEMAGKK